MLNDTERRVINLWNCCIWLVNLFELYDDARTCQRQISLPCSQQHFTGTYPVKGLSFNIFRNRCNAVFPSSPQISTASVRVTTYSSHSALNRAGRPLRELWVFIRKVLGANLQPWNLLFQMKCCLIFLRSSNICWDSASIRLRQLVSNYLQV